VAAAAPELVRYQLATYELIRSLLNEAELTAAIADGTIDAVLTKLLSDDLTDPVFNRIRSALNMLVIDASQQAAHDLPAAFQAAFDAFDLNLSRAGTRLSTKVIQGLKGEVRETVRQRAMAGIAAGENPRATARAMRGVLGLAPNQEEAVRNFERMLRAGDRQALTRALRDHRFDATLAKALGKGGTGLTEEQIRTMADAYRRRMIAFNAETHARSAALDINKLAQRLSWEDAAARGIVDRTRLMRTWVTVGDSRVRDEHREMNGTTVGFDDPYRNGEMIPGESTYNCRCIERIWLSAEVRLAA